MNKKFKILVNSIQRNPTFMKLRPIIIDEDFKILGGNMRHKACLHLRKRRVWVDMFTKEMANENNTSLTINEYLQIISLKTAELFGAAMKISAILTKKSDKMIKQLNLIGLNFGMIFQIIDDHLDYFGTIKTGKVKGKDFFEGKITLPIIVLFKKTNPTEKKWLSRIFKNKKRSKKDFLRTRALLEKYDIENLSLKYANDLKHKSKIVLKTFKNQPSILLQELLDTSINRDN